MLDNLITLITPILAILKTIIFIDNIDIAKNIAIYL